MSVSADIPPNEPRSIPLIENGKGIATFAGLLPGGTWSVAVAGGERPNPLQEGMTVTIAGTNVATGKPFHIPAVFETKETGDPAEFVERRVLRERQAERPAVRRPPLTSLCGRQPKLPSATVSKTLT